MISYVLGILTACTLSLALSLPAQETFPPPGYNPIIGKYWSFIGPFPADAASGNAALEKEFPPDKVRDFCSRYPDEYGKMVFWGGFPAPNSPKITFDIKGRAERIAGTKTLIIVEGTVMTL